MFRILNIVLRVWGSLVTKIQESEHMFNILNKLLDWEIDAPKNGIFMSFLAAGGSRRFPSCGQVVYVIDRTMFNGV